jgi:hypothetical protein
MADSGSYGDIPESKGGRGQYMDFSQVEFGRENKINCTSNYIKHTTGVGRSGGWVEYTELRTFCAWIILGYVVCYKWT